MRETRYGINRLLSRIPHCGRNDDRGQNAFLYRPLRPSSGNGPEFLFFKLSPPGRKQGTRCARATCPMLLARCSGHLSSRSSFRGPLPNCRRPDGRSTDRGDTPPGLELRRSFHFGSPRGSRFAPGVTGHQDEVPCADGQQMMNGERSPQKSTRSAKRL